MAETLEQLIEFAKGKLRHLKSEREIHELWSGIDHNLNRTILHYENFLESHGVEVEKNGT